MKIQRLLLENFEAFKHCMQTDRLLLDFSEAKNKVCLIIGPNGSGKTTILSLLNPFATLGNLDVRDSYGLICPHKDGKKEIWIQDGKTLYTIQHYYTATKETHSTKSFIQKDGEELNPNGNVTSFKEKVKEELHLELDYLKLVRLGPNVKSLIDLSAAERKNFMVNLLDDIGIYTQYYKHVNGNMRALKEMLSHTMDKLKRCRFESIDEYQNELEASDTTIRKLEGQLRQGQDTYAILSNKQNELGDPGLLRSELDQYHKQLRKMEKARKKMGDEPKPAAYYKEAAQKAQNEIVRQSTLLETTSILLERELEHRDELEGRLRKLEIQINQEASMHEELQRIDALLEQTRETIVQRKEILKKFHSEIPLEPFEEFYSYLKASELTLRKLYDFGQAPIKKIIQLLEEKRDVGHFINSGLLDASKEEGSEVFLNRIQRIGGFTKEISCETKTTCEAYKVWEYFHKLFLSRTVTEEEKGSVEFYHEMELIHQSLMHILNGFKLHKDVIGQLPKKLREQFLLQRVFSRIAEGKPLYDQKEMDHFYSLLKEQHELESLETRREQLKEDRERLQKFSKSTLLTDEYDEVKQDLQRSKDSISQYRDNIQTYRTQKQEAELTAEAMGDAADACENYEMVREVTTKIEEDYDQYQALEIQLRQEDLKNRNLEQRLLSTRKERASLDTDFKLYTEMCKNLQLYQLHYDNMEYTKKALSASKGIPTLIVKHYLQDTETITNELLDIAYNGEVVVEKFDINADTFAIPVYIHGARRPDVKLASQGEVAFLSVALSFALISQSLGKYNIMSLDEVDGPLDHENRRKFISILENQIERIGSEQNFLITHNDMFANYPVDIIDLSWDDSTHNKYELANFIPVIRD